MGCLPGFSGNSRVGPGKSLIELIKGFETDEVLRSFIEKHPKQLSNADEVGVVIFPFKLFLYFVHCCICNFTIDIGRENCVNVGRRKRS